MTQASSLEYALVGLLKERPQSGYDLRKTFATTPMRHFSDSPGSIYPALRRLQARAWIKAKQQEQGRKRQLMCITSIASRAFLSWLKQAPSHEDVVWRMEEVMLRFAFHDGNVPRQATLAFLSHLEQQLDSYLQELHAYAKNSSLSNVSTGQLAFACGVKGYEAQLSWTKQARKKLMEASS